MAYKIVNCFVVIFCLSVMNVDSKKHHGKIVTTLINARWEVTPIVLEIAEFIADENSDDFWSFIDVVSSLDPPLVEMGSEKEQYDKALELASLVLSPVKLNMLRLSLSLHIYSPKIEMYGQMAVERGVKCPAAVDFNGRLFCQVKELKEVISQPSKQRPDVYRVDHHYPGSENHSSVAILYGELGSSDFVPLHSVLSNAAKAGLVDYVLRTFVKERPNQRVRLAGYGVELQMKSTEYKVMDYSEVHPNETAEEADVDDPDEEVEGLYFHKLKQLYPDMSANLDAFRNHLREANDEKTPLKVWQVQELSLQAAERVLAAGSDGLKTLIHISHNFPLLTRSLIRQPVRQELKTEIKQHRETISQRLNLAPADAALFLNGIYFDADVLDVFSLLETLRAELRVMEGLHALGVSDTERRSLLTLDLSAPTLEYAIDIRDSAVLWVNDIEADRKYKKWSDSLLDLLRPTFPGMLRSIRRNLFNLVVVVDPAEPSARPLLKLLESFYVHSAPLHLGIVYVVPSDQKVTGLIDPSLAVLIAVNYVTEAKDPATALSFITEVYASVDDDSPLTPAAVHSKLKSKYPSADIDEVFGADSAYETGRQLSADFITRSGLRRRPQALLNGVPLSESALTAGDFEEAVLLEIMRQTPILQTAVYRGDLVDTDNVLDFLMTRPNVMPRLNERILSGTAQYLDLTGSSKEPSNRPRDVTARLMSQLRYFKKKSGAVEKALPTTHWVIADLETFEGRTLLKNAVKQMLNTDGVRVGCIISAGAAEPAQFTQLVLAALDVLRPEVAAQYIVNVLENEHVLEGLIGARQPPFFNMEGLDKDGLLESLMNTDFGPRLALHKAFVQNVLKWKGGTRGVVSNGRIIGPFPQDENFIAEDFALLDVFCFNSYSEKVLGVFKSSKAKDDDGTHLTSDVLMKTVATLAARPASRSRVTLPLTEADAPLSTVVLPPRHPDQPAFEVVAIFDPVSRGAQKLGPILANLHQALNMRAVIHLNCVEKSSDLPLKNFYRFVMESELSFNEDGRLSAGPLAKFNNLPLEVLFTQAMHVPENWLVESVKSKYDLDNIKLDDLLENIVHSEFELEHLLLEGHCFEATQGNPPRGLQMTLGTERQPVLYDTIVMANLGYFQLKANPGAWLLRLREGRSSELYTIVSHEGSDTPENSTDIKVIISSFRSNVLKLRVQKKPDKQNMDLLSEDGDQNSGIWNSITSSFSGKAEEESDDVINIFSLASGHLYERFLKIMMLSVLKHTKTPVKFWFLKNYLSPTLKDFLAPMSKEYGFQYELVQYKWPRWLHQQTEKQRIIWGYKILFLDVLFPLHVKKIIFVDADQVVRADMAELRDLDLGGAPYGYTPFCESRKEMDGFRFWKQGYWRNHLQGRRYHISALYVVDLKRFRRIAAGDRLRGQYQALSQDPNSLSNLDQDLPNNMIHQVAIKSLPQEWLWCETWCDDASKAKAKTIDLCNNPQTKEAKLTAAMRIVPEWKDYDNEIKIFTRGLDASTHLEETVTEKPLEAHHEHSEL